MRSRQRGVTFIGWLFLLLPIGLLLYVTIRLVPIYLNFQKVNKVMNQVATEYKGSENVSQALVMDSLSKRITVEGIYFPKIDDFALRKSGAGWEMQVNYEETPPMFYNVSLLVAFEKTVKIE